MSLAEPCSFPVLAEVTEGTHPDSHAEVRLENAQLEFGLHCKNAVELLPLVKAAWSLVLHKFCEVDLVSFGVIITAEPPKNNSTSTTKAGGVYQESSCFEMSVTRETSLQDLTRGVGARAIAMPARWDEMFNTGLSIAIFRPSELLDLTCLAQYPKGARSELPSWNIDNKSSLYAVELRIEIYPNTVTLILRYRNAVLSEKQAHNVASTVEQAFISLLQPCARTVGNTSLISNRNHDDIARWNGTDIQESSKMIHELFRERCVAVPKAVAVCSWDGELTYHDLDAVSDRVAAHLAVHGVGTGVFVSVCFEKSKWFVVAALAVLKAGGCYVPLDPSNPVSRLQSIVHEAEARLLLASSQTAQLLSSAMNRVIILSDSAVAELPEPGNTLSPVSSSAPAYILYTSGSTGSPKGCLVDHRGLASVADSHGTALQIQSHSRVLQFASCSFGMALIDLFCMLTKGGAVCIPSETERTGDLIGALNRLQVTWSILTPSLIKTINPSDVPGIHTLAIAGEPLPRNLIQHWAPRVQLVQAYGLTEWAGICAVSSPLSSLSNPANIGAPPNARFWLVDPENPDQLAPIGAVGEMLLEGPCLAQGYFKQHEETTRSFISPPSWRKGFGSPLASRHFYRTGDMMRYRPDGDFNYIGRKGTQVKIRGQRVELGEVEYHIGKQFGSDAETIVAETMVLKGEDQPSLVAFILLRCRGRSQPSDASFLAPPSDIFRSKAQAASISLSTVLPRYMLPDFYVPLSQVPLTISRKTSRKSLRQLGSEKTRQDLNDYLYLQKKHRNPRTLIERVLHGVFSKALDQDPITIGIDDSFFELGGDSILGMRAVVLCRKQKIPLTMQDIFRYRTIAELAKSMPVSVVKAKLEALDAFDLSSAQQAFLQAIPHGYNNVSRRLVLRLKTQADVDTVRYAVSDVVKRHSILRTTFERGYTGQWRQHPQDHSSGAFGFRADLISDITEIPRLFAEMQASLDIETGPVFTSAITECESGERHLLFVIHCLVMDKQSWAVLCKDLDMALERDPAIQEPPLPFRDWCQSQQGRTRATKFPLLVTKHRDDTSSQDVILQTHLNLDEQLTETLVGKANLAFRTLPVDILHAALRHSYMNHVMDAPALAVFLELPGRGSPDLDTSNTVGWLDTIISVQFTVDSEDENDIVEFTRRAKDARNGLDQLFSSDRNTEAPLTVLLRFDAGDPLAQWQGQAVEQEHLIENNMAMDAFPPLAVLDVMITMAQGQLHFTFRYHDKFIPSTKIHLWVTQFERSLQNAALKLSNTKAGFTLGDLGLPSISYERLHEVIPCSPMQQGILLSHERDTRLYQVQSIWKAPFAEPFEPEVVLGRFQTAWQQVVDRHAILRTVMVESRVNHGSFDQVILKEAVPKMENFCLSQGDPLVTLRDRGQVRFRPEEPQHKFIACNTGDAVYLSLVISHALIDAQ
ncbi:unnamed protein product [Penicillium egyptiacum]|uniref:Carrier domain-containing protein n=1 Tax=Penicillium egyptiacum TaxID=1303716 RepID=A0A9W4KF00_9EURO|nr:unnamed protein product [Penicillium egyptiacum]